MFWHGTGNPGEQQSCGLTGLHVLVEGQHPFRHERGNPAGQQSVLAGSIRLHVLAAGQQKPLPQSSGNPPGQVVPQLVPSALHTLPTGQQVNSHATGVPAGQQRFGFSGLHVLPGAQHLPGPQVVEPEGHAGTQLNPSAPQDSFAAQQVCAHATGDPGGQHPWACGLHVSPEPQQKLPQSTGLSQQHDPPPKPCGIAGVI